MKEKILVTGAYGFLGKSIQKILSGCNDKKLFLSDKKKIKKSNYFQCDFVNYISVKNLIHKIKPDKIYHLAGTFTNVYKKDYFGNVLSTENILSSIKKIQPNCRVMLIGSAAEYGMQTKKGAVKESQELNPLTFYGLSKVFQTHLMRFYHNQFKLDLVMVRPFNIYGEGASNKLFSGRLFKQIERYTKGEIDKINLGYLDNMRDYISIDYATEQVIKVMNYGKAGEIYNIGSGFPSKTKDLLKIILKSYGLGLNIVESSNINKKLFDPKVIYADISKIEKLKGKDVETN